MKLFLSYSSKDYSIAQALVTELTGRGLSVWFAPAQLNGGSLFAREIPPAILNAEVFLLLATRHSVGCLSTQESGSKEVSTEINIARDGNKLIIPLKADESLEQGCAYEFYYFLKNYQWIDIVGGMALGDYGVIAEQIRKSIDEQQSKAGYSPATDTLKQIEGMLKQGSTDKASLLLSKTLFPSEVNDQVSLLKIISFLQECSLKSLTKAQADSCVNKCKKLFDSEVGPAAIYLCGILSKYVYPRHSWVDPNRGLASLHSKAAGLNKVKAKYVKMLEPVLPVPNQFALEWMRALALARLNIKPSIEHV